MEYYVEVVKYGKLNFVGNKTEKVVEKIGPMSEDEAETVERGILKKYNHKDFYARIVTK